MILFGDNFPHEFPIKRMKGLSVRKSPGGSKLDQFMWIFKNLFFFFFLTCELWVTFIVVGVSELFFRDVLKIV